jgi:uncharacterized integral membrane protein
MCVKYTSRSGQCRYVCCLRNPVTYHVDVSSSRNKGDCFAYFVVVVIIIIVVVVVVVVVDSVTRKLRYRNLKFNWSRINCYIQLYIHERTVTCN